MNLRVRAREEPAVNLTSLIDVVFLLLIFFMVSTTFVKESEISIELPQADAPVMDAPPPESIEILVSADGRYFINQRELIDTKRETLRNALSEVSNGDTDRNLLLSADADARHQLVVTAMDIAGKMGFENLSISTVRLSDDEQ
ncbi:MAG: biopolymer transporter ExbD [Pseudomonadota bacterium]